jgi:hypothetical protein
VALWFPFARDLLWRETEVVSQATKRIWSAGLAKYTNENVAALIPKGGEYRRKLSSFGSTEKIIEKGGEIV